MTQTQTNMWAGPGRAVQFHVGLRADVYGISDFISRNEGKPMKIDSLPPTLSQRMATMSSMGDAMSMLVNGKEIVDGYTAAQQRNGPAQFAFRRAVGLIGAEVEALAGETHYLSHNIMSGIVTAADSAGDEPLFPTDLPARNGLLVFEYPLIIDDLDPKTGAIVPGLSMPIRAIAWTETDIWAKAESAEVMHRDHGIAYVLYTDGAAIRSIYEPKLAEIFPDDERRRAASNPEQTYMVDMSGWSYGKPWERAGDGMPRDGFGDGTIHDTVARIRRFLLTYMRFCWQRLLVPTAYTPSRAEYRRAERAGAPLTPGYIKVLHLRRVAEAIARGESREDAESAYARDFAWMVRGHPRRQHYPSLGPARHPDGSFNHDSHRLIWIDPFVKGNPDGPLIIGHDVTAVVR